MVLIAVSEKSTPLVVLLIEERERECGEIHSCVLSETAIRSLLDPSNLRKKENVADNCN